ncbi:NAD(P)-binding domain protein [Niveomyces insectorum RCEF 264]|uniref:NAD(P)-binding domain protein n=1 Tax=Niveomyces insectorum RCEF 264 TaxID=1081102 RepID=A0A167UWE3_9HYPO|nr:NAD(P)-binding domain protein [Niveomyces insectorum RCEF 264]
MDRLWGLLTQSPFISVVVVLALGVVLYLAFINGRMSGVPDEITRLTPNRWSRELLKETYARLEKNPITLDSYRDKLPPKQDRRYVVTGGCGLVGGYIVLQLLARGQPPESIRIADYQAMHRQDMLDGPARDVDVVHTDISSPESTDAAFGKAWPPSVADLPLTVFHTAAVMVPSERTKFMFGLLERINIKGTENVLAAARRAGADVFVATASGSITIRPVHFWMAPWPWRWRAWPRNFVQCLDEADFFQPIRPFEGFYSSYSAAKATAERIVCGANCASLRTGTIRPANGVYGHPTDNTLGGPLNTSVLPAWSYNISNSFVHGANCALAHLHFEAVLADPGSATAPQAGRPFTVTDPNVPIRFSDLWLAIETLSITPFRTLPVTPIVMLLLSYVIEAYCLLPFRFPVLKSIVPPLTGDIKHLKPPLFSIITHLYATNEACGRAVRDGGLGYHGVLTTLEGVVQEILDWNHEHAGQDKSMWKKYRSSVSMAEEIAKIGTTAKQLQTR